MYIKIKKYYESIIDYFPEYSENPEYIPPKRFLWDIFWTMDRDLVNTFIAHSLKERNHKDQEGDKTVEVLEDVLNQLHSAHYFSKKKGKALFMLTASKELGIIKKRSHLKHLIQKLIRKKQKVDQKDQSLMMT